MAAAAARRRSSGAGAGAKGDGDGSPAKRSKDGFLKGVSLCLLEGSCESQQHARSRKQLAKEHGAICTFIPQSDTTHVLCSPKLSQEEVRQRNEAAGHPLPAKAKLVHPGWFVQCMKDKAVVDEKPFLLPPHPHAAPKRSSEPEQDVWAPPYCLDIYELTVPPDRTCNEDIIAQLARLADYYRATPGVPHSPEMNHESRRIAYQRAVAVLRGIPRRIRSGKEVMERCRYISDKIASKIDEFLKTGKIQKVIELCDCEYGKAMLEFAQVHSVGPSLAAKWYAAGYRTVADVPESELTPIQKVVISYLSEILQKIPRTETEQIYNRIRGVMETIGLKHLETGIMGSYARGKAVSSDVDILVKCPADVNCMDLLRKIVEALKKAGLITDILSFDESFGKSQYTTHGHISQPRCMSIAQLSPKHPHRRLDITTVTESEYPCAVLSWIGSAMFSRSLRQHAENMGYRLSTHALDKITGANQGPVPVHSEEDVFRTLGVKQIPPELRNC